jgi:hypothetical protein
VDTGHFASVSCASDDEIGHNWIGRLIYRWDRSGGNRRRRVLSAIFSSDSTTCTQGQAVRRCGRSRGGPDAVTSALQRFTMSLVVLACPPGITWKKSSTRSGGPQAGTSSMLSGMRPGWSRTMRACHAMPQRRRRCRPGGIRNSRDQSGRGRYPDRLEYSRGRRSGSGRTRSRHVIPTSQDARLSWRN